MSAVAACGGFCVCKPLGFSGFNILRTLVLLAAAGFLHVRSPRVLRVLVCLGRYFMGNSYYLPIITHADPQEGETKEDQVADA